MAVLSSFTIHGEAWEHAQPACPGSCLRWAPVTPQLHPATALGACASAATAALPAATPRTPTPVWHGALSCPALLPTYLGAGR